MKTLITIYWIGVLLSYMRFMGAWQSEGTADDNLWDNVFGRLLLIVFSLLSWGLFLWGCALYRKGEKFFGI